MWVEADIGGDVEADGSCSLGIDEADEVVGHIDLGIFFAISRDEVDENAAQQHDDGDDDHEFDERHSVVMRT